MLMIGVFPDRPDGIGICIPCGRLDRLRRAGGQYRLLGAFTVMVLTGSLIP